MTHLRARFHFGVRGLLVGRHLLGGAFQLSDHQYRAVLTLPSKEETHEESGDQHRDLSPLFPPDDPAPTAPPATASATVSVTPSRDIAKVNVVRVDTLFERFLSASHFAGGTPKESASFDQAVEALREAGESSARILARFLDWVRVERRQHWLGVGGETPLAVGPGQLVDLEANAVLPVRVSLAPDIVIRKVREEQILDKETAENIVHHVTHGRSPLLADALLADALYYGLDAEPLDFARAVLIAAMACELKVKYVLRSRAEGSTVELVDIILNNPRDYSLAAPSLFHELFKAVAGRSLREEEKSVFKALVKLFEARNGVAHRGQEITEEEAVRHIKTAIRVCEWVDGLV